MTHIVHILLPDIRSAYNVGSVFRSADCFGAEKVYLTGTTPKPIDRFGRPQKEIAKTALGGEKSIPWEYSDTEVDIIKKAKGEGFLIIAIEQHPTSISPKEFLKKNKNQKVLLVFGNEVDGVSKNILKKADHILELPMKGEKESLNVSVCAGVVLYEFLK